MTTSTTRVTATASGSTPEDRCDFYRSEYGLPAALDRATERILMPVGGLVGAVTMPVELGRRVQARSTLVRGTAAPRCGALAGNRRWAAKASRHRQPDRSDCAGTLPRLADGS